MMEIYGGINQFTWPLFADKFNQGELKIPLGGDKGKLLF